MDAILGGIYEIIMTVIVVLISSVFAWIWKKLSSKNKKLANLVEKVVEEAGLTDVMQSLIMTAENFKSWTKEERKLWVMTQLKIIHLEKGIEFDEEKVSDDVEKEIKFTNSVNTPATKRSAEKVVEITQAAPIEKLVTTYTPEGEKKENNQDTELNQASYINFQKNSV